MVRAKSSNCYESNSAFFERASDLFSKEVEKGHSHATNHPDIHHRSACSGPIRHHPPGGGHRVILPLIVMQILTGFLLTGIVNPVCAQGLTIEQIKDRHINGYDG